MVAPATLLALTGLFLDVQGAHGGGQCPPAPATYTFHGNSCVNNVPCSAPHCNCASHLEMGDCDGIKDCFAKASASCDADSTCHSFVIGGDCSNDKHSTRFMTFPVGGNQSAVANTDWQAYLKPGSAPAPTPGPANAFEPAWRAAALTFAKSIQPDMSDTNLNLLQEGLNFIDPKPPAGPPSLRARKGLLAEKDFDVTVFVGVAKPCDDSDSNPGTSKDKPFCTISRAVSGCRAARASSDAESCAVRLLAGTHRLKDTIVLGPLDSNTWFGPSEPDTVATITGAGVLGTDATGWTKVRTLAGKGTNGTDLIVWGTSYELPGGQQADTVYVDGVRAIRARYPNADPETDRFPVGWIHGGGTWLGPKPYGDPKYIEYNTSEYRRDTYRNLFQNYRGGVGGQCSHYTPPFSYWCAEQPEGGGATQYTVPGGISFDGKNGPLPNGPYKSIDGAVLVAWRPGHWANWGFDIASQQAGVEGSSSDTIKFEFGAGGFQGGRGNKQGAEWYVDNVAEELDYPREFYHDTKQGTIYFVSGTADDPGSDQGAPPRTAKPPSESILEHARLKTLFSIQGTQASPVRDITITGLRLTGAALTFFDPHGVPSGGDWALQRSAALFVEGAEGFRLEKCNLTRLDGNALMLSGYNQNATISQNTFLSTGSSAIALWGYSNGTDPNQPEGTGPDGTQGNFPRYTLVDGNFIRYLGIHEKQSSCFFQAKAAQSTVRNNICFDVPRAGFNFNDGFGGGDEVYKNLLFQTCGESGDHGAINSWDRQSFLTTIATGKPSIVPAVRKMHHNLIVSDFDANGGMIDNDDGSSFYEGTSLFYFVLNIFNVFECFNATSALRWFLPTLLLPPPPLSPSLPRRQNTTTGAFMEAPRWATLMDTAR